MFGLLCKRFSGKIYRRDFGGKSCPKNSFKEQELNKLPFLKG
jgi:hypothetical protein